MLASSASCCGLLLLAMYYLMHADQWMADLDGEPSEVLIARALEAGMPPLEQAILFRFQEVVEGKE